MYKKELQIEIDDVYACGGKCPGCILSSDERKTNEADMHDDTFDIVSSRVKEYILSFKNKELDKVNITYGIGDHFRMSNDYLERVITKAINTIEETGFSGTYSSVFVSTSLIDSMNVIKDKIDLLSRLSNINKVPVIPLVVFDPAKLYKEKYWDKYIDGILYARSKFDRIDLAINLSDEVVQCLPPEQLFQFAKNHKFKDIAINWVPSKFNIENTTKNIPLITKWLLNFRRLTEKGSIEISYSPVIERLLVNFFNKDFDFKGSLKATIEKSLQIDHNGVIFPKMEGIGDVPFNDRVGLSDYGSVLDDAIKNIIEKNIDATCVKVLSLHSNATCSACEYMHPCSLGGFHAYNNILKDSGVSGKCKHVAFDLFNSFNGDNN